MPDPSPENERHARIAQVKQDWAQRLLADPNVVAVGIGPKIVAGRPPANPRSGSSSAASSRPTRCRRTS